MGAGRANKHLVCHLVGPETQGPAGTLHDDGRAEAAEGDGLPLFGGEEELFAHVGARQGLPANGAGVRPLAGEAVVVCTWQADGVAGGRAQGQLGVVSTIPDRSAILTCTLSPMPAR
jgi:hypothetical protein